MAGSQRILHAYSTGTRLWRPSLPHFVLAPATTGTGSLYVRAHAREADTATPSHLLRGLDVSLQLLAAAGLPVANVNSVAEALAEPQVRKVAAVLLAWKLRAVLGGLAGHRTRHGSRSAAQWCGACACDRYVAIPRELPA